MELLKNLEGLSADEQMSAVVELQKAAMKHLEEQKQASIGKSAEMVILGLKKIKSDFEAKFDSLNYDIQTKVANLKDGQQGLQGPKGEQGDRGLDGYQGKDGKSGIDGKDGLDGKDGVSVQDAKIDFDGSLVITLSDGREINVGEVVPVDVAQTIHKIQSGSGGDSQTTLNAIAALQATIATYGTMATQNANNVAITGGTINNTTIGATTPAAATFTTLTAQNETLKGTGQNLILQSQTYTNSSWNSSTATRADNQTTAPDSTNTAGTITSVNTVYGGYLRQTPTLTATTYTLSVYIKKNNWTYVGFRVGSVGSTDLYPFVNLDTGATNNQGLSGVTLTATSVGSGWYRCVLVAPNTATGASPFDVAIVAATGNVGTNNGAGQIAYVWGAQLEIGSTANTYIPTTTTAVYGTPTLSFSGVASIGLQSDGSLYETSAGTGNVRFYTNNIGQEQARVSHTASAVNFVNLTGGATATDAQISALGSDTNIWLQLNGKGSRGVAIGYFTRIGRNFANYFEATGNNASSAPILSVGGSDTNIDLNLTTKGTGAFVVNTGGGTQFKVLDLTSATTSINARGGVNGGNAQFGLVGTGNTDFIQYTLGTGAFRFLTNGIGVDQFRIAHTASAVNYVQVTGSATSGAPVISVQGSDTNITAFYQTKGVGSHVFGTRGTTQQFRISDTGSAVNYFQANGSITGFGPVLSAQGSDTNIPAVVQPKGTGALQAQQTDSTATGGNARGANAVDWQTVRNAAVQVASGQYSVVSGGAVNRATSSYAVVSGGNNNQSTGFGSVVAGGNSNVCTNSWAFLGAGQQNTVNGYPSAVVTGVSNSAAGYHNFIGAGFTNSGTANAAVTTQSATMNGTTAVTLSGSNASIKVGQWISGTSIADETYVAAISGTSLTLSKVASGSSTSTLSFYTPHGVVVGGGNNQATGSYSFIGGGGDAGTAANRNVASGDFSFVGGGKANVASGLGSVVVGGGTFAGGPSPNTASGAASFIGGGFNNAASNFASSIIGGNGNLSNGNYSCVTGVQGSTRSINNSFVISSNALSNTGDSQTAILVIRRQTTDATPTVLTSDGSAAATNNQVILPNNSAYYFKVEIIANVTGGGNTSGWELKGVIKRGANAASTAIVGSVTSTLIAQDAGASTWVVSATADTTNGGLKITVTGQASTTIRWVAKASTTEVTF